jgi:hypothetical protein
MPNPTYFYVDLIADLQFKALFTTTSDDRIALINQYLTESELMVLNEAWSQRLPLFFWKKAVFLMTAHRLSQYDRYSSAPISFDGTFVDTSKLLTGVISTSTVAVGSSTVEMNLPDSAKMDGHLGDLTDTIWGLQLIEIIKRYKFRYTGFTSAGGAGTWGYQS